MNIANQIGADNVFGDKTEENIRDKCNIIYVTFVDKFLKLTTMQDSAGKKLL